MEYIKKIYKYNKDILSVTSIFVVMVILMVVANQFAPSFAYSTELPDTLTTGMGNVLTDRVTLFSDGLSDDEIISLVPYYATDEDGNRYTVYCLEKDKGWPSNDRAQTITKSEVALDPGYVYILQNGYPNKSLTGNAKNDDYLTQIAIWYYQDLTGNTNNLTENQKAVIRSSQYYRYIEPLITGAVDAKNNPVIINPSFSINSNDFKLSSDNKYLITDLITVDSNVSYDSYAVSIDNNAVEVLDSNNNVINSNTINSGDGFKLRVDLSKLDNPISVNINVVVNYTEYEAYSYNPPSDLADSMQQAVVGTLVGVLKQKTVTSSVEMPSGSLTIRKVDSNSNPLEGASIEVVRKATNSTIASFNSTTSDYVINNLLPGEYDIKEISAPNGYYIDNDSTNVIINNKNLNVTTKITNSKYEVKVRKIDSETKESVRGAVLNIVNSSNQVVDTITTEDDYVDVDTSKMSEGTYKVVEVKAPDGYILTNKEKKFTLDRNNTSITIDFEDEKNEIIVEKKDANSDDFVKGAVLRLINVTDDVIDEWTTDGKGHSIKGLVPGEYKVVEIKAPNGYTLNTEEVPVTITGNETEPVVVTFENTKNSVTINKIDSETRSIVSGAELKIINDDNEEVARFTTSDDPYVIEGMEYGTYTLEEVKAKDGYVHASEQVEFTIDENTTNISVTLENTKTKISLGKVDSNNNYIAGATLKLTDSNGDEVETFTSGSEPYEIEGLKYGTYTLEEIEAPSGYIRNSEKIKITVDENTSNGVYTIVNDKSRVTINKIDKDSEELITGAVLQLLDSDKEFIRTIDLSSTSSITLEGLDAGTYYLKEIEAPDGYLLNSDLIEFTIDEDNPSVNIDFPNEKNEVVIEKRDKDTNEFVRGAVLRLVNESDQIVDEWTTDGQGHSVRGLEIGNYKVIEVSAPDGYTLNKEEVTFTVSDNQSNEPIVFYNSKNQIEIIKIDSVTRSLIGGARLEVTNSEGDEIDTFTTTNDPQVIEGLKVGTYYVRELEAPSGYVKSNEVVSFEVREDTKDLQVVFENTKTKISLGKVDTDTGSMISRARLRLTNSDDEEIETFTSSNTLYEIEGLKYGTYYLEEIEAPSGYIRNSEKIKIIVDENTTNAIYTISNAKREVTINKIDKDSKELITGAVLQLLNSDKEFIRTIDLSGTSSITLEGLDAGTYYLKEIEAPDGYLLNDDLIEFTIDSNDSNISVDFPNEKNEVIIEKKDANSDDFVSGAILRLIRVSDNEIIDEWTSNGRGHSIKGLMPGEYRVIEVSAPNGYTLSNNVVPVTITSDATSLQTVTFYNSKNQITISKIDSVTRSLIGGAKLRITDSDGDVIDTFTTTDKPYALEKLDPGTYYVEEIEAPSGYIKSDEVVSFDVDSNTNNLNVTLENTKTKISLGKVDSNNNYIVGARLKLTDSNGDEVETFTSESTPYEIEGLKAGTYYLEELEAPSGYIRNTEKIKITIDENTTNATYTITNDKSKVTINKIDKDSKELITGAVLQLLNSDKEFIRTIDLSSTSSITLEGLDAGTYYLKEIEAPDGYLLNSDLIEFTIDEDNPSVNIDFPNEKNEVIIEKKDLSDDNFVEGSILRLIRVSDNQEIDEFEVTNEGYSIRGLIPGVYELQEVKAPDGYQLNTGSVSFNVLDNETSRERVTFYNSKNQITINKIDSETKETIKGAKLEVTNSEGEEIETFTTTDKPYTLEKLDPGTYYVKEIEAPSGYVKSDEVVSFDVDSNTNNLNVTFENTKNKIRLGKIDTETRSLIGGAKLRLTNSDGEEIETFISSNTLYEIEGLKAGTYYLEELEAPEGYILNDDKIEINITSSTTDVTYTISNKKSGLTINKIDKDSKELITGAVLQLLDSDKEFIRTIDLSSTSSITLEGLDAGTYYLKEIEAPDGYLLNSDLIEFTIDSNNPNISVDFPNEKNEIIIEKRDKDSDEFVKGARLRLVRLSDNEVIDEWTSNGKGHSIKGVVSGEYKVIEVSAPDGYTLNTEEVTFTVTDNQSNKPIVFYNSKNQVVINKIDSETRSLIGGAKLRITNSSGDVIDTFTTTKEAYTLDKLSPGTYYVEEIEAPSGYQLNTEKESFTIDENTTSVQVTMKNVKTRMYLAKVDEYGECIPGATLRLLDSNKEEVETFVSGDMPYFIEGLDYGTYYLEEVKAPDGYIKNSELKEINYNADNASGTFSLVNRKGRLTIEKIDSETKEAVSGATLELRKGNEVVKTITTTNSPTVITDLGEGTYEVVEVNTPSGYIKSDKKYSVTIDANNPNARVIIENKPIIVNLGKIDAVTGEYISGATMRLERLDGEMEPITFVSSNSPYQVSKLAPGVYSLEEIEAPSGYVGTGSKVTFRVLETGKVQTVNISNDITTISVNNRILTVDTKGIEGYRYRLETRDGNVIDEFTTTDEAYTSDSLEIGEYTLKQIDAPEGVIVNESPIYFSVSDSNEVSVINFVNDFTKVSISKKDMVGSEEVEGAHLVIRDNNGEIVEEWVSSNTPHYIEKLPVGKYTLTETIAPDGYILNTSVIEFNVLETGDIQSEVMFNSKPIEVPNTSSNATYIYLIGGILIIIGGSIIYISYRNKTKYLSR